LNFPVTDYKRFLNFLDKHHFHVAFQPFRSVRRPAASGRDRVLRTNVG
jgi:hypothetical protein